MWMGTGRLDPLFPCRARQLAASVLAPSPPTTPLDNSPFRSHPTPSCPQRWPNSVCLDVCLPNRNNSSILSTERWRELPRIRLAEKTQHRTPPLLRPTTRSGGATKEHNVSALGTVMKSSAERTRERHRRNRLAQQTFVSTNVHCRAWHMVGHCGIRSHLLAPLEPGKLSGLDHTGASSKEIFSPLRTLCRWRPCNVPFPSGASMAIA